MNNDRLILITNPGSSSRKYALYKGSELVCSLHFEFEGKEIVCTLKRADDTKKKIKTDFKSLTSTVANLEEILTQEGYLGGMSKLDAILARVAAPGEYFSHDHIVDEECLKELEAAKARNELSLIEVKCSIGARDDLGRPTTTALENKENFMEYIK